MRVPAGGGGGGGPFDFTGVPSGFIDKCINHRILKLLLALDIESRFSSLSAYI
jgi:hypothetical protein